MQAIAHATYRLDQFHGKRFVNMTAETAHTDLNGIQGSSKFIVPDMVRNHFTCQDLVGVVHQIFKQSKEPGCEFEALACPLNHTCGRIEAQITHAQGRGVAVLGG
jgi:hypothetical protein